MFSPTYGFRIQLFLKQDAQLSQRDRAAGCFIVFAKSRRLELGDNDLRTLFILFKMKIVHEVHTQSKMIKKKEK